MVRSIAFHGDYFINFYKRLDKYERAEVLYVFELIKQVDRVPRKFLAPVTDYEGSYEIRVQYQSNVYRIFCCFDEGSLIILFNGFQKKSQKAPKREIEKAMRLKMEYFKLKNGRT